MADALLVLIAAVRRRAARFKWFPQQRAGLRGFAVHKLTNDGDWPNVDLIIAVHNEAAGIAEKIRNTAALAYPVACLRVWIVDGASNDGTMDIARACIAGDSRFRWLAVPVANKTVQLNAVLRYVTGEWVLITDADARLPSDTIQVLVRTTQEDPRLGVVGTPVEPAQAHPLDRVHWRISNWVRRMEACVGCGFLVVAPCYFVRRSVLTALPVDVVADDVHVALAAMMAGLGVGLAPVMVREVRSPRSMAELIDPQRAQDVRVPT